MKYVDKVLLLQEHVVARARIHWFVYVWPSCLLLASIACFRAYDPDNSQRILLLFKYGPAIAAWVLLVWAVVAFVRAFLYARTTELAMTNQRIIMKRRWIACEVVEVCGERVEACRFEQSVLGRLFNYGTVVVVAGAGTDTYPVPYIKAPLTLRAAVAHTLTELRPSTCPG